MPHPPVSALARSLPARAALLVAGLVVGAACGDSAGEGPHDAGTDAPLEAAAGDAGADAAASFAFSFTQDAVGDLVNERSNGAWWGENITKITNSSGKVFSFAIEGEGAPREVTLLERAADGTWAEGATFPFARPPNLLLDQAGHVHVVGFIPFDAAADTFRGRIVHIRFDDPDTVTGDYEATDLSEDWGDDAPTYEEYQSLFVGAAIGTDDTILVAYNNSVQFDVPGTHSLAVEVRDPDSGAWAYEQVVANGASRLAYPFAFVSAGYFHVYAVEDDFDPDYTALGPPYDGYTFRYGLVKHYQRPRSGGPWAETTVVDFNGTKTKAEIWHLILRGLDFHVDAGGRIHALYRYNEGTTPRVFLATKLESEGEWTTTPVEFPGTDVTGLYWAKFWDRGAGDAPLLVGAVWNKQLRLLDPLGDTHTVSALAGDDLDDPTPFLASARAGSRMAEALHVAVFSGSHNRRGQHVRVVADDAPGAAP